MTEENLNKDTVQTDEIEENNEQSENDGAENDENKSDKQDAPKGTEGLDTKSEGNEDIYGSPDNFDYSEIKLPEGMTLDNDLVGEFEPIARKLNLSNSSANELMNLAVKLSSKNMSSITDALNQAQIAEKNSYMEMLEKDTELNANDTAKYNQYLNVAVQGLNAVATDKFKEFINAKGLTHHPEFIKVFHNIGKLCKDAALPNVNNPVGKKEDAADVLYGASRAEE